MAKIPPEWKRNYEQRLRELRGQAGISEKNKFNASLRRDLTSGHTGSGLELSVLALYRLEERTGEITELRHQHQTYFSEAKFPWRLDFSFYRQGEFRFAEAKGCESQAYRLQLLAWRIWGPAPLELWYGDAKRPFLKEIIFPKYYIAKELPLP